MKTIQKVKELKEYLKKEGETIPNERQDTKYLFWVLDYFSNIISFEFVDKEDDSWVTTSYFSKKLQKTIILDESTQETFNTYKKLLEMIEKYEEEAINLEERISIFNN